MPIFSTPPWLFYLPITTFGDKNSTIGRYLSQAELAEAGIYADDLSNYEYLGRHDAVAAAILRGEFDAGALKDSTYNKYKDLYKDRSLVILKRFRNVTKPWIAREGLDPEIYSVLWEVLLDLKDPAGLESIKVSGFAETSDEEYDSVRKRMKDSEKFFKKEEKP